MIKKIILMALFLAYVTPAQAASEISKGVTSFKIKLNGQECTISRNQTVGNKVHPLYETTHRGKPTPIKMAPAVETMGELEFIAYMKKAQTDKNIMIIDTRTEGWHRNLRIPCTKNIPYTEFSDDIEIATVTLLEHFGVKETSEGKLDFSKAKTVVGYCNGFWCGQTPGMFVRAKYSLANIGYPREKMKYYRGGMQAWTALGMSVEGEKK